MTTPKAQRQAHDRGIVSLAAPLLIVALICSTLTPTLARNGAPRRFSTARQTLSSGSAPLAGAFGFPMGVVTGAIYNHLSDPNQSQQSFETDPDKICSDFYQMGAQWIRIQARWVNTNPTIYRSIVQRAHAWNLRVLVVVLAPQYNNEVPETYAQNYLDLLNSVSGTDFGATRPDAWEISNEPNNGAPNVGLMPGWLFPRVLFKVWNNFRPSHANELIISGGILNTYTTESWWQDLLNPQNWVDPYTGQRHRPFDLFGIHPYNSGKWTDAQHQTILNQNPTANFQSAFDLWDSVTTSTMSQIYNTISSNMGDWNWKFFVTEFGFWQKNGVDPDGALNQTQQAYAMQHACSVLSHAVNNTNQIYAALWHQYRDFVAPDNRGRAYDKRARLGIRGFYSDLEGGYPAKQKVWRTFRYCATGIDSAYYPNYAWETPQQHFADVFPTDRGYAAIDALYSRNVISGYACGTEDPASDIFEYCDSSNRAYFRPDAQLMRGQMSKIVALSENWPTTGPHTQHFTDVPSTSYLYDVVETCYEHNIISGYTCGGPGEPCDSQYRAYFRPFNNVTRGQMTKMVVLAEVATDGWYLWQPTAQSFADDAQNSTFWIYIENAYNLQWRNITNNYRCGGHNDITWDFEDCANGSLYYRTYTPAKRGDICTMIALAKGWASASASASAPSRTPEQPEHQSAHATRREGL